MFHRFAHAHKVDYITTHNNSILHCLKSGEMERPCWTSLVAFSEVEALSHNTRLPWMCESNALRSYINCCGVHFRENYRLVEWIEVACQVNYNHDCWVTGSVLHFTLIEWSKDIVDETLTQGKAGFLFREGTLTNLCHRVKHYGS